MDIEDLVKDWGGFEKLIAALHETGDVTVERNVTLEGRSGATRQVDVLLRHRQGLYEHLVIVECKYWKKPVERLHVDALATTVRELGAAKGVIFTTKGFQTGAVSQASHESIELFKVRELSDEEWGMPGRVVDLTLQIGTVALSMPTLPGAFSFPGIQPDNMNLSLRLGDPKTDSQTPFVKVGEPERTLETYISRIAAESSRRVFSPQTIRFPDGTLEGELLIRMKVNVSPEQPMELHLHGGVLFLPRIEFDIGVLITQSRIHIDRSSNFTFALAIENCVTKTTVGASRRIEQGQTLLHELKLPTPVDDGEIVRNGTLISVWLAGFQQFDRFAELPYGKPVAVTKNGTTLS
ncbi:MAG TPA: restriction endonuclease [Ramlibacter sp.]|uniref:restriction endonuclease n=1 Tax=Ramlibacter sp. TaxID=1917967 RepID=UPI002ED4B61E